jgi:type IV pilus assembly protein PilA
MAQMGWQQPQPTKSGMPGWATALIVILVGSIVVVPILAVLAIYGVRKYVANAKTAEAKNSLAVMGRYAAAAYEKNGKVCPSASEPVPQARSMISGRKYQSTVHEWQADAAANAGFACLGFEMTSPQYFQYEYIGTPTGFTARAHGDLNGDGVFSTYEIRGQVMNGKLVLSPSILETDPFE